MVESRTSEMRAAQSVLERMAITDGLTGLLNRKETERRLVAALQGPSGIDDVYLALIDLDHFKQVNDDHGHLVGDEVIRATAQKALDVLSAGELACRYGGEEFLVILRGSDRSVWHRLLDFHREVAASPVQLEAAIVPVTLSIGVTRSLPGDSWKSLIGRADTALYAAKKAGRNRIISNDAGELLDTPVLAD